MKKRKVRKRKMKKKYLLLNKFPTQVVVIEKCENTFDNILDEGSLDGRIRERDFQIITTLYVYQKI